MGGHEPSARCDRSSDERRRVHSRPGAGAGGAAGRQGCSIGCDGRASRCSDHGDREIWRWRPDRERRRAQNLGTVVESYATPPERVERFGRPRGETDAGAGWRLHRGGRRGRGSGGPMGEPVGVIYFDTHADLNVPGERSRGRARLDGMAHMLGGRRLRRAGSRRTTGAAAGARAGPCCSAGTPRRRPAYRAGGDRAPGDRGRSQPTRSPPTRRRSGPGARAAGGARRRVARPLRRRRDRLHRHAAVGEQGRNEGIAYERRDAGAGPLLASPRAGRPHDHRAEPRPRRGRGGQPRAVRERRRREHSPSGLRSATCTARWGGSRGARTAAPRRCCPATGRSRGRSRPGAKARAPGAGRPLPIPRPRWPGQDRARDSISPIRGPVTHVSSAHDSSALITYASP